LSPSGASVSTTIAGTPWRNAGGWLSFLRRTRKPADATVMLGVPAHWRELKGDAGERSHAAGHCGDGGHHQPLDGRALFRPGGGRQVCGEQLKPDLAWCRERGIDYLPVVFSGL